jgi:hypothetical protein
VGGIYFIFVGVGLYVCERVIFVLGVIFLFFVKYLDMYIYFLFWVCVFLFLLLWID